MQAAFNNKLDAFPVSQSPKSVKAQKTIKSNDANNYKLAIKLLFL